MLVVKAENLPNAALRPPMLPWTVWVVNARLPRMTFLSCCTSDVFYVLPRNFDDRAIVNIRFRCFQLGHHNRLSYPKTMGKNETLRLIEIENVLRIVLDSVIRLFAKSTYPTSKVSNCCILFGATSPTSLLTSALHAELHSCWLSALRAVARSNMRD